MAGIIDYIKWRGDLSFDVSPLNPVDSLIFSKLTYMKLSEVLNTDETMTIESFAKQYEDMVLEKELGALLTGEFDELLKHVASSNRFRSVQLRCVIDLIDLEKEIQFSSVTFEIDERTAYIAFRGTDDTLVGWKEDFNMAFMDVVPAQEEALKYLNEVGTSYKNLYVGGHSKGGNLAVYSSAYCDSKIKVSIVKTFNHDGPGFKQSLLKNSSYHEIQEKVLTLIPQSSVIGMLLEHEETYQVVKSTSKGLMQHDGFSWEVEGPDFVYLTSVDDDSKIVDLTTRSILSQMPLEERKAAAQVFFEIISVNESRTLTDIQNGGLKSLVGMSKNYTSLDKNTKKAVNKMLGLIYSESLQSLIKVKNIDQWNDQYNAWKKEKRNQIRSFLGIEPIE